MKCTVVTTTWNSQDVITTFLRHYVRLGVERFLVMDFDSNDGTADLLAASEWRTVVRRVPFPGLASLDSSNRMLAVAREDAVEDEWLLFCDPDELLVIPQMSLSQWRPDAGGDAIDYLELPRFNMSGPASAIDCLDADEHAACVLTLRVEHRIDRNVPVDMRATRLDPPWIFTRILPKVLVRARSAIAIGDGDHTAQTRSARAPVTIDGAYLLHYPFRSFAGFADKIARARRDFEANPHLPAGFGWQIRRWIEVNERGGLRQEYREQFVPDSEVSALLERGVLSEDESIRRFMHAHDQPCLPSRCRTASKRKE